VEEVIDLKVQLEMLKLDVDFYKQQYIDSQVENKLKSKKLEMMALDSTSGKDKKYEDLLLDQIESQKKCDQEIEKLMKQIIDRKGNS
jgi:hypothetical protein